MISQQYLEQIKELHRTREWGASGYSHAPMIRQWCEETNSRTVLDYGCGTGTLKAALSGIEVFEYDPAIPGKDGPPRSADLLVATDVLEHVEQEFVDDTLKLMRSLAIKAAYLTIDLQLSRKVFLPDGRNVHVTLLPSDVWLKKLETVGFKIIKHVFRKSGVWVWAR
jgi:hypothetical protein